MPRFLVAADAVRLDDAFLARLASETRKPRGEWERAFSAPGLGRIVMGADTERDAGDLASRLATAGLVTHVVPQGEAADAVERAFEATWAEPAKDGLLFIGADGSDLRVRSIDMRSVTTGRQTVGGQAQYFCVVGLRINEPGAVILRIPGAELSKLVREADNPEALFEGLIAALGKIAGHAKLERGLEKLAGRLPGLDEAGSTDLAHAGVVSAWLARRFPPPAPPPVVTHAPEPEPPPPPLIRPNAPSAPLEVEGESARAQRQDVDVAVRAIPKQFQNAPRSPHADVGAPKKPLDPRILYGAAAAGAVIVLVLAFLVLRSPARAEHTLKLHESWKSPYGVTFTYAEGYDAGFGDIHDNGFIVELQRGGEKKTMRVAGHDAKTPRDAGGASWHVESFDSASFPAAWIVVAAEK